MLQISLNRFLKQSELLLFDFTEADKLLGAKNVHIKNHCQQMTVVRLQDSWSLFVKNLILNSASGRSTTLEGTQINSEHSFKSYTDVYTWVMNEHKGSGEPDWHVTDISLRWCRLLSLSNRTEISSALGSTNSPERVIRDYRNFIVHRCRHTSKKLENTLRAKSIRYDNLQNIPNELVTGGITRFENWVKRFQLVAIVASK